MGRFRDIEAALGRLGQARPRLVRVPARGDDRGLVWAAAAAIGLGVLGVLVRERVRARRLEQSVHARLRLGPQGIVAGAEPVTLRGSDTHAVLVLHGFGDTPQSVRELAESLHDSGYTVDVPLLPGHGRTLVEFGEARATDWVDFVRARVARLRARHAHVSLVGLSMGAALCSIVAAERDDVDALVLLAPYLSMPEPVRRLTPLLRASGPIARFRSSAVEVPSIKDPVARARGLGFGVVSGRLLQELQEVTRQARAALPNVTVPTLYLASRNDSRVPAEDAARNWGLVHAPDRAIRWLDGSGHIVTVDYEKHSVFEEVEQWLERHGGVPGAPSTTSG